MEREKLLRLDRRELLVRGGLIAGAAGLGGAAAYALGNDGEPAPAAQPAEAPEKSPVQQPPLRNS